MRHLTKERIITLSVAAVGAMLFLLVGLPLPLLLGPMIACLVVALMGAPLQGMGTLGVLIRTFLGVAIGTTITPDLIANLPTYGISLLLVPLCVLIIGAIGYPYFRKVARFDHPTAFYSAMPGGLQDMLIFGEEAGGDVRAMGLVHATRVLVIVTLAPVILTFYYNIDLTRPPGLSADQVPPDQIALMVMAGVIRLESCGTDRALWGINPWAAYSNSSA